jgi:hypothetical protein
LSSLIKTINVDSSQIHFNNAYCTSFSSRNITIPSESEDSKEEEKEEEEEVSKDEPEENYTPFKTFVKKVKYRDGTKTICKPIFDLNLMPRFGPAFKLPPTVQPLALSIIKIYYPDNY